MIVAMYMYAWHVRCVAVDLEWKHVHRHTYPHIPTHTAMSFGGFRGSSGPSPVVAAAEQEMEMITTLFNNIVETCHAKCIQPDSYFDADIHKGEAVCIDRCVSKYFEVNMSVGKKLSARAAENAAAGGPGAAAVAAAGAGPQ